MIRRIQTSLLLGAVSGSLAGLIISVLARSFRPWLFAPTEVPLLLSILVGAALGSGFGILTRMQRSGVGESLFWGMSYGAFLWVLGQLTLIPLILNGAFTWDLGAAQASLPALVAWLIYGSLTGLLLALFRMRGSHASIPTPGTLGRGALAGFAAGWVLGKMLGAQGHLVPMGAMFPGDDPRLAAWITVLLIGSLAGMTYAALYTEPREGAGVAVIRGAVYGFFWWLVGALTILPLLSGLSLAWSLESVRVEFPTFPAFILFGSLLALFYVWSHRMVRILLSEDVGQPRFEGPGAVALRTLGRGAVSGIIGGAVFTFVMVRIGFLPNVASLIGSSSPGTGLLVHFVIAMLIGMSYGLLFRRQSFDLTSALGWGLTYGFIWWILGALTLMPIMLGGIPQWTAPDAALAFPALVGHLGYGAGLGVTFYLLEARDRPWWLSRSEAEAERIARRKDQILTSAPAVWVLVVMIALTLPILLGG
jgi:uncharacterized membrane protein YagU involved in acid resistance